MVACTCTQHTTMRTEVVEGQRDPTTDASRPLVLRPRGQVAPPLAPRLVRRKMRWQLDAAVLLLIVPVVGYRSRGRSAGGEHSSRWIDACICLLVGMVQKCARQRVSHQSSRVHPTTYDRKRFEPRLCAAREVKWPADRGSAEVLVIGAAFVARGRRAGVAGAAAACAVLANE